MSTKATIKSRHQEPGRPGFHLYSDVLDELGSSDDSEQPVYLRLEGVQVELQTSPEGACVTVALPRELARELGLVAA